MFFILLAACIVLLGLSAGFSAAETSFFSLDALTLERFEGRTQRRIRALLADRLQFLIAILLGNIVVNVALSAIIAEIALRAGGLAYLPLAGAVSLVFVIIFGEVLPKAISVRIAPSAARFFSLPFAVYLPLVRPVVAALARANEAIERGFRLRPTPPVTDEELATAVHEAAERGALEPLETRVLHNALRFRRIPVRDLMTPRADIVYVRIDDPPATILEKLRLTRLSRFPVVTGEDVDGVVGCVYAKEVLLAPERGIAGHLRRVYFAPEAMPAARLFRALRDESLHLAMIVDEYGVVSGLASFHDLIEEILGEIPDEFSVDREWAVAIGEEEWLASGKAPLEALNEELGLSLPTDRERTLGGWLFALAGHLPARGEVIRWGPLSFVIRSIRNQRIAFAVLRKEER
ncbi:MAG: HlyC/CorC family transporter [Planctomycetes bacterium]|nr:HlyC/CorC family transporter [Planctomycetota bacterium]